MKTNKIELSVTDAGSCRVIKDPINSNIIHVESLLSFREVNKLKRGNANVRPPQEKRRPFKAMVQTVEESPQFFHIKNRGITYICSKVEYDDKNKKLIITIPNAAELRSGGENVPRYGIADGGHTFEVIRKTIQEESEKMFEHTTNWTMPFVRVHFLTAENNDEIESVVEALNTSSQVQQYTLDEYQNKFEILKKALTASGFDSELVGFRENEEDKDWHVIEVIQRLACFLKERWVGTQPAGMYKSKGKALRLFTNEDTRAEFKELFPVIKDIITLPEYIQSEFSKGDVIEGRKISKLKAVKVLKKSYTRPGTTYETNHKIDMAALLPLAAGFRELLVRRGDHFEWRLPVKEVFKQCAVDLYDLLAAKTAKIRVSSELSSDPEFWGNCVHIVLRAKDEILDEQRGRPIVRKKPKPIRDGNDEDDFNQVAQAEEVEE